MRLALLAKSYASLPVVLSANLINGGLVALVFSERGSPAQAGVWYAFMLAMIVARIALWRWYQRAGAASANHWCWRQGLIVGSAASGVLWGAAGVLFGSHGDETARMVMSFMLGGMGAGTAVALTPVMPAFYAFLFPAIAPFTLRLALEGGTPHLAMASACVVYLAGISLLGRRAHRWLVESLVLRFENGTLVQSLEKRVQQRTAELEATNAQLALDIAERRRAEAALAQYGDRQSAIASFGEQALSGCDLEILFGQAVDLVCTGLETPRALVLEHVAGYQEFTVRLARTESAPALSGQRWPDTVDSPAGYALRNRQPVVCPDVSRESRFRGPAGAAGDDPVQSTAVVVIPGGKHPFGVLVAADDRPREFTAADVSYLQSIANMLAAAIDRKETERNVQELALRDPLTDLPNRVLFYDHLCQGLARVKRHGEMLAILLLDLDHFKDVNDSLGHAAGDDLLIRVASRLRACTRESDPPARLGGDEFALILPDLRTPAAASAVAQKIAAHLAEPFLIEGHEVHVGVSIGITVCPADGEQADQLLRNADLALYRAKFEGRGGYHFYAPEMTSQVEQRRSVERDLRRAIAGDELVLHYQPQVDLIAGRIVGAEALIRWHHPARGLLRPDGFLGIAETTGLLAPLGNWVLERACRQARACRGRGLPPISTAINIAPVQCQRGDLAATLERIANAVGCELSWLELEVTEQMFHPAERSDCLGSLQRLKSLGVAIAIDDFGTGYSNLGRLQALPVDRVKIDRAFISELGRSRDAELIVRAIISLSRNLGLEVVAEGVETEEQLAFLKAEGCHRAQGFGLSPPLAFDDFVSFLGDSTSSQHASNAARVTLS